MAAVDATQNQGSQPLRSTSRRLLLACALIAAAWTGCGAPAERSNGAQRASLADTPDSSVVDAAPPDPLKECGLTAPVGVTVIVKPGPAPTDGVCAEYLPGPGGKPNTGTITLWPDGKDCGQKCCAYKHELIHAGQVHDACLDKYRDGTNQYNECIACNAWRYLQEAQAYCQANEWCAQKYPATGMKDQGQNCNAECQIAESKWPIKGLPFQYCDEYKDLMPTADKQPPDLTPDKICKCGVMVPDTNALNLCGAGKCDNGLVCKGKEGDLVCGCVPNDT
jgi:hypothetical protein